MVTKVKLEADKLAFLQRFVSKEETRYYLNGVYVEPVCEGREIRMVATDGHHLGCMRQVMPSDEEALGYIYDFEPFILRIDKYSLQEARHRAAKWAVVDAAERAGLARKVAKLVPIVCVKG